MKKTVYTAILLVLIAALPVTLAGCFDREASGTTAPTAPEGSTIPSEGAVVGDRDDFFDDVQPPETEPKPSEDPTAPSTEPATEPSTEPTTEPVDLTDPTKVTYAQYEAMTREQQKEFMKNFASTDDYIDWLAQARENDPKEDVTILDGNEIDLGKLLP